MKKIVAIGLVLLFALTMFQSVSAVSDLGYLTEVTSINFLPATIHAGDTISVAVDIKNRGSNLTIGELRAILDVGNQFTATDLNYLVGDIKPQASKTAILKFTANDNIVPGYYPIFLTLTYDRDGDIVNEKQTISVPVAMSEKNIDVTVDPKIINPGNQTEMTFTLKNISGTSISNVAFSWDEVNDLILPLGSDNKRYVNNIHADSSSELVYIVAADPNIAPGIYPLDVTISFTDVEGTKTQESEVGLIIGGETDFEVSAEVKSYQLSLSIANIGSNNAESVVIKVPKQGSVSISGTNIEIVGNLNKGDFTLANFSLQGSRTTSIANKTVPTNTGIRIPGLKTGKTQLPESGIAENSFSKDFAGGEISIQIDYTDTTGERHTVIKKVDLSVESTQTFDSTTKKNSGFPFLPIGLMILFIGGGIFYNHKKPNKNWKKLGIKLAIIAVMFLIAIFLLGADMIALAIATIVSAVLMWKFFGKKE